MTGAYEQALIPQVPGYQLPEPVDFSDVPEHAHVWGYTASQMQQAYQDGREAMRQECLDLCYDYVRNATDLRDAIKGIK